MSYPNAAFGDRLQRRVRDGWAEMMIAVNEFDYPVLRRAVDVGRLPWWPQGERAVFRVVGRNNAVKYGPTVTDAGETTAGN